MNSSSWIFLIITICAWGATPVLEKTALKSAGVLEGLFIRNLAAFLAFFFFMLLAGRLKSISRLTLRDGSLFIISGVTAGFLGMYCYYRILKANPSSVVVPLSATYPLIAVLLGILFLKEGLNVQRILGTLLIVSGIILIR